MKYSQVFLKDAALCERIASELKPEDFAAAVEIGPGRGALTEFLYPLWGDKLSVVEIDPLMAAGIRERFPGLRINNADFMTLDLEADLSCSGAGPVAFIGNLPYECSTAILFKTLACSRFGAAVFMFQREVAEKIMAQTGDTDYSYLSVAAQALSEAALLAEVPSASFSPAPKVDSSVLILKPKRLLAAASEKEFFSLLKAAFAHRRKTLVNSLALSGRFSKAAVEKALSKTALKPGVRPQELSLENYMNLLEELKK